MKKYVFSKPKTFLFEFCPYFFLSVIFVSYARLFPTSNVKRKWTKDTKSTSLRSLIFAGKRLISLIGIPTRPLKE